MNKLIAEFLGTAFLLLSVVGSGIMGWNLADGNSAIALLANAVATGCALYVLITVFGPISGAHFNPVVTVAFWLRGAIETREAFKFIAVQIAGGICGVLLTHVLFDVDVFQTSSTTRFGINLWVSEVVATFGLLLVIFGGIKYASASVPAMVGVYITGAYWFTSSTSFANPAVTIARIFSDSFAGIHPGSVMPFILCQILGLCVGHFILTRLYPD